MYEPTALDIAWTADLIASLQDGGVWGWPAIGGIFRIDKTGKRFIEVEHGDNEGNDRFAACLAKLNWSLERLISH